MLLEVAEDTITADTAAVLTNKLLQLAGGAVYNADHQPQVIHSCKIEAFLELVEKPQWQERFGVLFLPA